LVAKIEVTTLHTLQSSDFVMLYALNKELYHEAEKAILHLRTVTTSTLRYALVGAGMGLNLICSHFC